MSVRLGLALLWAALVATTSARAQEDMAAAFAASRFIGYAKAMYVADDKKGGRLDQGTPGFGGKAGVETGSWHGFRLRGAWYVTSDLGLRSDNPRETDAYMFDLDKRPYSLLGEAQLVHEAGGGRLTLGRQEFHSPLINSYDYRIIPNLFEAATFAYRPDARTTLTLAHVGKMSGLDGLVSFAEFRSMSQQAYTSLMVADDGAVDARHGHTLDLSRVVGRRGVWAAGFVHEQEHRLQLWNYLGVDSLNTLYLDGRLKTSWRPEFDALLEAQAYRVSAVGGFRDYLARHGLDASYTLRGIRGTLSHRPGGLSVALAFNRYGGDRQTVTAHGNWGGYPEFVPMPYLYAENDGVSAIARSRLTRLTALLDLGPHGWANHSLLFGHARIDIDERILPGSDIRVNSLLYRGRLGPKLSLRILLEARNSGNARYDNEFVALSLRYDH